MTRTVTITFHCVLTRVTMVTWITRALVVYTRAVFTLTHRMYTKYARKEVLAPVRPAIFSTGLRGESVLWGVSQYCEG